MNIVKKQEAPRGTFENIIFQLIRSLYILFVVSRACMYKAYRMIVPAPTSAPVKSPPDYNKIYKKYIDIYANPEKNPEANINIDNDLYDYEKRKEIFKEEKNVCEEHWKKKLMYEFTPRGNVIVYYNPYKHAFMYYSDENSIPYNIMQYVAKKYVVMFRCRDFYIDPESYPDNKILEIMKKEEEALNVKSKKVKDITKCIDKDLNMNNKDIFATLKSYKQETVEPKAMTQKPIANDKQPIVKQPVKNVFSNTFVRLGKTCEFNIIQKPPDKNIAIVNSILFGENNIGKTLDFFDTLEINDNVVENPFLPQNVENNMDLSVLKKVVKEPDTKEPDTKESDTEEPDTKEPHNNDKKQIDETPIDVEALSKAKSWKEFKSLSRR